jgi:hypothetical protein
MFGGMGHIELHLVVSMSHFVGWLYWMPGCLVDGNFANARERGHSVCIVRETVPIC